MIETQFRLRQCGPGDEQMLSLVGGASFLEAFADVLDAPDILAHFHKNHSPEMYGKYMAMPTGRVAVAEVPPGNVPVGYIICCEPDFPIETLPSDYELRRIYLLHRFQGLGIGKVLMDRAIEYTRKLGRKRLILGVYGKNHAAIRFYERAGFTQIGERFFTVGSTTHHDAVMAREV
ncbi:N-acetyltransferase [Terriglobus sp. TAA 43]|uniref:GNAT family N-acetyltransferase n=1 Tax=Terriglobus sp. TAA 43 TaxID=278961 RepID=UPI0006488CBF|nr:GNAT family N-acetyltransferase [Terriglobus sp. TAA 43]